MADAFTFFIYLTTLFSTVLLVKAGYSSSQGLVRILPMPLMTILGLIVLVTITGLRHEVGEDFQGYVMYFYEQPFFDDSTGFKMEPGYMFFVKLLTDLNLKVWTFFTLFGFITYSLLLLSFRDFKHLTYLGVFFFMTFGFYFFTLNGVRQGVAVAAFGLATSYSLERKLFKYIMVIVIGGLIHKSLFLFIPFYFVLHKIKFSSYIWFVLFILSVIIRVIPIENYLQLETLTGVLSDTSIDYSSFPTDELEAESGITLGYILRVLIGLFILYFYEKLTVLNPKYIPYFTLTLIGILLYNAFSHIQFFSRLTVYFTFFSIFTLSFIVDYLTKTKKFILKDSIIVFFLLLYCYSIYVGESGTSPYKFISF